jgi:hypothetical protein
MVRRDSHSLLDRVGYLLEIQAGAKQAWLHERSVRQTDVTRYYETNHNLLPGRKQYFFTTSYLGAIERAVSFDTTILIDGDARIVSARRVDLSNWKDIEVSTVFYDGERSPGSPRVDGISNRTIYAAPPLNEDLLTADEYLRLATAGVHQLVTFGPTATSMGLRPVEMRVPMSVAPELFASTVGVGKVWEAGFMRFTTLSTGGQGWLRSPNLTADGEGTIYLRVRYRLRKGNLAIALFPDGGAPQICQQAQAVREGEFWIESVSIRRHAGQAFFFVIANGYVPHDDPTDADVSEVQLYAQ